ncbi:hypothetical protein DI09_35p290 [Mitosporidium daphniae]|uniref:Uncharacterized protein n=1 Tax=Mitosporidium daphniae TaxID=1485682 RepID=A0A098VUT5_9MICR|nr:uncharacterized protein DI09_35p290 [Mitosporidium daphniae]KGG51441.1 hypothetical protein DI09_35p290 [Mitosporidium daphniae]|eukprot:XP_013237868.1 uncharacterized protein DI09_35p290 [Mitosporidium daphniae]
MRRSFKFDACVHENHSSYNSISDFCEHIGIPALVECLLQGMQYFVSHIKGTTLHCSRWHLAIPKKSSSPGAVMKLAYRRMSLIVEALQILRQVLQGVRADLSFGDDLSISSACLDEMFDHIFKHQDSMLSSIIWINATFKSNDGKCLSPTFFLSDLGDYCGSVLSDSQSHFSHIHNPTSCLEVPYSKHIVTEFLKEAFGGHCQTCIVAHLQNDNSSIEDKSTFLDGLGLLEMLLYEETNTNMGQMKMLLASCYKQNEISIALLEKVGDDCDVYSQKASSALISKDLNGILEATIDVNRIGYAIERQDKEFETHAAYVKYFDAFQKILTQSVQNFQQSCAMQLQSETNVKLKDRICTIQSEKQKQISDLESLATRKAEESCTLRSEILQLKDEIKTLTASFNGQLARLKEEHGRELESSASALKVQLLEREKLSTESLIANYFSREKELSSKYEKTVENLSCQLSLVCTSKDEATNKYEAIEKSLRDYEIKNVKLEAEIEKLKSENQRLLQASLQVKETIPNLKKGCLQQEPSKIPELHQSRPLEHLVGQSHEAQDKDTSTHLKRPPQLIFSSSEEEEDPDKVALFAQNKSPQIRKGHKVSRCRLYSPKKTIQRQRKSVKIASPNETDPTPPRVSIPAQHILGPPDSNIQKKQQNSPTKKHKNSGQDTDQKMEQTNEQAGEARGQTNKQAGEARGQTKVQSKLPIPDPLDVPLKNTSIADKRKAQRAATNPTSISSTNEPCSSLLKKSTFRPLGPKLASSILSEENSSFLSNLSLSSASSEDSFSFSRQKHPAALSIAPKVRSICLTL